MRLAALVLSFGTGDRFTLNGADVIPHPVTMAGAAVPAYAAFRTRRTGDWRIPTTPTVVPEWAAPGQPVPDAGAGDRRRS